MSDKLDLVYDLVSKIDERQRIKAEADAARHANEDAWRTHVDSKLEEHTAAHIRAEERFNKLEETGKVWNWFKTKTGKVGAGVAGLISTAYAVYRMLG